MKFNVDIESLSNELGFDKEDVEMLLTSFVEVSRENLSNLKNSIEDEDYGSIARFAHSIKGSSLNLKLEQIAEISREIELKAKEGDSSFDYKLFFNKLEKEVEDLIDE